MPVKNTPQLKKTNQIYSFRAKKEAQQVIDLCDQGRYSRTELINDAIAAHGKRWLKAKVKSAEDISGLVDEL